METAARDGRGEFRRTQIQGRSERQQKRHWKNKQSRGRTPKTQVKEDEQPHHQQRQVGFRVTDGQQIQVTVQERRFDQRNEMKHQAQKRGRDGDSTELLALLSEQEQGVHQPQAI
jgi:hypothetical protein